MKIIKENVFFEEALPYLRAGHAISHHRCGEVVYLINERHTPRTKDNGASSIQIQSDTGKLYKVTDEDEGNGFDERIRMKFKKPDGDVVNRSFLGTYNDIMESGWDVYENQN